MSNVFSSTEVLKMPRSLQKYAWNLFSSMSPGKLYPLFVKDCIPGQTIRIDGIINVKAHPMVTPNLTPNNFTIHFFFVPYRKLDENFETGIVGTTEQGEAVNYDFPKWEVTATSTKSKTLWDYMGLPINVKYNESGNLVEDTTNVKGVEPSIYLKRAYNFIYNKMYRNENYSEEIDLDSEDIQFRCWRADYFVKALPWQQKPSESDYFALPINTELGGNGNIDFLLQSGGKQFKANTVNIQGDENSNTYVSYSNEELTNIDGLMWSGNNIEQLGAGEATHPVQTGQNNITVKIPTENIIEKLAVNSASFDVADLRLAVQMQKWAERNARGGSRYDEALRAHFGVTPKDARLQLPEFIGGFKFPILTGENYSTVETNNAPQGTRAGIGNGMGANRIRKYFVEEYGLIMGIASILPQASYQQGMPREWIKHTQLDFFHHELCCLSEREVYQAELVCSNDEPNTATTERYNKMTFGFQGMYNEYRYQPNKVTGEARLGELAHWHQSRIFDPSYQMDGNTIKPATVLGKNFVEARDVRLDCFAVTDASEQDPYIITAKFQVKEFSPITYRAEPGLVDHF